MENGHLTDLLHAGHYSCVIRKGSDTRTFHRRGVIDIYELYQTEPSFLQGASIADKVIGKGAAALLVLAGIAHVYADVISTPALSLFRQAGISVDFGTEVPHIINRKGDGYCPLETACGGIESPQEMYPVIQDFVRKTFYQQS